MIALSDAEFEFIAAVSAAADGIYPKRILEAVLGTIYCFRRAEGR